jgi:hypothetical protein
MLSPQRLLLLGSLAAFPPVVVQGQGANAQAAPSYTLSGLVHDDAQAPVSNAELKLTRQGEGPRLVRTGSDGRFDFDNVQPGSISLSVRRMGYKASTRDLTVNRETASRTVEFALVTAATDVAPVVVEGENDRLHEFYERRQTNSFGKYFDGAEIRRRDPRLLSEILRTVPGAVISNASRVQNRILLRGCRPTIWENGMKAFGAELDDVANPSDIAAMEVYLSWAGLPPQYQDRANPGCGAILLWTRDH